MPAPSHPRRHGLRTFAPALLLLAAGAPPPLLLLGCAPPLLLLGCAPPPSSLAAVPAPDPRPPYPSVVAQLVDPFIGTAGEGNTFPGAVLPWGLAAPSPHTIYSRPQDYIAGRTLSGSGYRHGEPHLYGLGLTHLSGTGCPDLGAPVVAATVGALRPLAADRRATFTDERAWPGYWGARLVEHMVVVEATATPRVAVLRLRFPERPVADANILIDAGQTLSWLGGAARVRVVSRAEIEGQSETGLFCARPSRQTIYFVARLDRAADAVGTWRDGAPSTTALEQQGDVGAFFRLRPTAGEPVQLAVGLSYVSVDGARRNLQRELGTRGFEEVRAAAFAAWEEALGRVRVSGGSPAERTIFYTALYHALLHPGLLADVDGRFPALRPGRPTETAVDYARHTVFSLWDSYRGVHPLLALLYPERQRQMVRSLAALTREAGVPPQWELASNEVNMMVGDPVIAVFADAAAKGLLDVELRPLYEQLRTAALATTGASAARRPGNASYRALGYVPIDEASEVWGPVSTTLEYGYADWALAELAARLGEEQDAARFRTSATAAWTTLFDAATGLLRPRHADGAWLQPFDPDALQGARSYQRSGGPGYVEGTAWHYAFAVPHDVDGLIAAHGGGAAFVARLQRLFDEDRFAMWNEPDIAFPYLFARVPGAAWRTQREVARARARFFGTGPAGLPGNDDAGALSAWFVFSALGLYPDCPGAARYTLGTPLFERAELRLDPTWHQGATFVLEAPGAAPGAIYVDAVTRDGRAHEGPFLEHAAVTAGGTLRLAMGKEPRR